MSKLITYKVKQDSDDQLGDSASFPQRMLSGERGLLNKICYQEGGRGRVGGKQAIVSFCCISKIAATFASVSLLLRAFVCFCQSGEHETAGILVSFLGMFLLLVGCTTFQTFYRSFGFFFSVKCLIYVLCLVFHQVICIFLIDLQQF